MQSASYPSRQRQNPTDWTKSHTPQPEMHVYDTQNTDELIENISFALLDVLIIFLSISSSPPITISPHHWHPRQLVLPCCLQPHFSSSSSSSSAANIFSLFFSWYIFALDCGCQLAGEGCGSSSIWLEGSSPLILTGGSSSGGGPLIGIMKSSVSDHQWLQSTINPFKRKSSLYF